MLPLKAVVKIGCVDKILYLCMKFRRLQTHARQRVRPGRHKRLTNILL